MIGLVRKHSLSILAVFGVAMFVWGSFALHGYVAANPAKPDPVQACVDNAMSRADSIDDPGLYGATLIRVRHACAARLERP